MKHILLKIKKALKGFRLHWIKRGITIAPGDYKDEILKIEWIRDNYGVAYFLHPSKLSADIRRFAHLLEKGIYMPNRRANFGRDNSNNLHRLLLLWDNTYQSIENETIDWASNIYQLYLQEAEKSIQRKTTLSHNEYSLSDMEGFEEILFNRRSCRNFIQHKPIPKEILSRLIEYANASPSSCNRQTCFTYVLSRREDLLYCENCSSGGEGFASHASNILIICADMTSYILPAERHLFYIDGGIYAQSLMLAAEVMGLSTCYLNWVFQTKDDAENLIKRFQIAEYHEIIGLICIGYSEFENNSIPRKSLSESIKFV